MTAAGPSPRLEGLDALRGFALMALFIVHMPELFELYWAHPEGGAVHDLVFGLFSGKAFALLALTFGVSFSIIMERAAGRGEDHAGRFVWRMMLLGLMGWLHGLIYQGEILQVLALMGLILIPFHHVKSNRILLAVAALCLLQPGLWVRFAAAASGAEWALQNPRFWTAYDFDAYLGAALPEVLRHNMIAGQIPKWLYFIETGRLWQVAGLFLCGLVLGRIGFFSRPERFGGLRLWGLVVAGALFALLHFTGPLLAGLAPPSEGGHARRILGDILSSFQGLSLAAIYLFGFTSLYHGLKGRVLNVLAPMGRMTLSLYVAQSLVFVPVFYDWGLGLHASMTQIQALGWGLLAVAVQIVVANLWFRGFHYGPLEWLWRAGTRLRADIPFRRR